MDIGKGFRRGQQGQVTRVSRQQSYKGFMKLNSSVRADEDNTCRTRSNGVTSGSTAGKKMQQNEKRKWRFRVCPRVRVVYSRVSALVRRLSDSQARVLLALAAICPGRTLLPLVFKKKRTSAAIGRCSSSRSERERSARVLSNVETKYMEYIKRTIQDGELAYYTMSLRSAGVF